MQHYLNHVLRTIQGETQVLKTHRKRQSTQTIPHFTRESDPRSYETIETVAKKAPPRQEKQTKKQTTTITKLRPERSISPYLRTSFFYILT